MASPHLDIRTTDEVLARLDRLAERIDAANPGVDATRSTAARAALLRGLDVLEAEHGIRQKGAKKTPHKA